MITVEEADAIFLARYNSDLWTDSVDKTKLLNLAMDYIDQLLYDGEKTDVDQLHAFPRDAETETPTAVKRAICEVAYAILDGVDIEIETPNLVMDSQSYGTVKSTYNGKSAPEHLSAGIPSVMAMRYLKPYLYDAKQITMYRV